MGEKNPSPEIFPTSGLTCHVNVNEAVTRIGEAKKYVMLPPRHHGMAWLLSKY